jgi:hypothetical protein
LCDFRQFRNKLLFAFLGNRWTKLAEIWQTPSQTLKLALASFLFFWRDHLESGLQRRSGRPRILAILARPMRAAPRPQIEGGGLSNVVRSSRYHGGTTPPERRSRDEDIFRKS